MPWKTTKDLPPAFKHLSERQKDIARKVANERLKAGDDEGTAIRKAIAAAKKAG